MHVFRWRDGCLVDASTVVRGEVLTRALDLSYGEGVEQAEAIDELGVLARRLPAREDGAWRCDSDPYH